MKSVNDLCAVSNSGTEDPYQKYIRVNNLSVSGMNDLFGDFAMKAVIWEIKGPKGEDRGALYRNAYINGKTNAYYPIDDRIHRTKYTYLEALDETNGAKPEGFQARSTSGGAPHANGGGWVASGATVASTAYVGPDARVQKGAVSGNARIEGHAVIDGGTVTGSAIVKDYAYIKGGTIKATR
jgi:hypothetical protein